MGQDMEPNQNNLGCFTCDTYATDLSIRVFLHWPSLPANAISWVRRANEEVQLESFRSMSADKPMVTDISLRL